MLKQSIAHTLLVMPMTAMLFACSQTFEQATGHEITSPSTHIGVDVRLTETGKPVYSVAFKGETIIDDAALGFALQDAKALRDGFTVVATERNSHDETWEQPWGEERYIRNHYNELLVKLEQPASAGDVARKMNVRFRVFDDGVGFRYEFPQQAGMSSVIIDQELTEFTLPDNYTAWWTPAQAGNQYEYLYKKTPVDEVELAHTPMTLKRSSGKGPVIALHEAALHDFSTMNLQHTSGNAFQAALVPYSKTETYKVKLDAPFHSPWRTIQVAEHENQLITSYLTLNLNEPNALGDVSWVTPGKYVGIWWELHLDRGTWSQGPKHAANTKNTKKYIDFAAAHGFDGVLVEGWNEGWDSEWWNHGGGAFNFTKAYPDYDVEALAKYAEQKGVFIIGHHETGAETDNYERQLEDAYQFLEDHGMKAVKTGYVETGEYLTNGKNHHGQDFVRHADKVTKVAAKHKVMVVAHETVKDTGERRTYPNLVAREVARGQEYNAWSDDGGNPPNHTAILPYTRMLSGPMDFTPGVFDIALPDKPNNQVNTTLAKQLALYVVIYSPVQMACDLPEHYEAQPDAFQFIKDVPVDWQTTRVLAGELGEYTVIARQERAGSDWYVGGLTNESAREVELSLEFLSADSRYQATIYRDADTADYQENPTAYSIETREVTASDSMTIKMARSGGFAVSLKKI